MGIKVGMVGTGSFAQNFIPLFKAHPLVDKVVLCDLDADKLQENLSKHGVPETWVICAPVTAMISLVEWVG